MARRTGGPVLGVTVVVLLMLAAPAESSYRSSSYDWAYTLAIQKDGKLVAAGVAKDGFGLARYTTEGGLDRTFGNSGRVVAAGMGSASVVAIGADRKILAGAPALASRCGPRTCFLMRYTTRGAPDRTFGRGGKVATGFGVNAIAIQNDGRIVASGVVRPGLRAVGSALARYTKRGMLDSSFGHGGKVSAAFGAEVGLQSDGKIVVAGTNSTHRSLGFGLARYDSDGTIDSSFGNGGKVVIGFGANSAPILEAMAIQPDGKIVAAGKAHFSDFALARFTADGSLDPTFGDGGRVLTDFPLAPGCQVCPQINDAAHALVVQADGKIVAAGESDGGFTDDYGFALARYNDDGHLDTSFGRGGTVTTYFARRSSGKTSNSIAEAVTIQRDGKIVAAGLGNGYDFALARYTTRGSLDRTFGRGGKVLTDFGSG